MEKFTKPAGTNDFLPEQMVQRNFVENIVRETYESYGYAQIQTPLFESFALLSAQSGEEIRHKMFTFVGPDRVDYALRPELTAPVCRIIANGDLQHISYPYKLYYIGQCVRQEPKTDNPDVRREFRQAGVELIGPASALADAEIITIPVRILEKLNISQRKLKIGNAGVFREIFKQIDLDPKDHSEVILDIDHLSRLRVESQLLDLATLRDELNQLRRLQGPDYQGEHKIDIAAIQELTENNAFVWTEKLPMIAEETYKARWHQYFNISEEIAQRCIDISKISGDKESVMETWETLPNNTAQGVRNEMLALCECLENYGITDFEINLGITRGFDFYTGTVFQIELPDKNLSICGGGRYDRLIENFGGPSVPGAGFAFQFDVLMEAFTETHNEPVQTKKDYFIATTSADLIPEAQRLAETLRSSGKTVEMDLMEHDLQAQHNYAAEANYDFVINLIPDQPMQRIDLKTKNTEAVTLKDLDK
ncbi:MAG: ATP phosphoribosyltransferase regulatory subunit [Candidatus Poribacteria bacterium]|nr:ATP phosphoribosyltransferase regulatory subunit [Candidatus Poribacteria bacterium]